MQTANQQLAHQASAAPVVSIRSLQDNEQYVTDQESDDDTDRHIQMDIACGIVELKDQAAMRAAEATLSGAACAASSNSGTDSDSDSESYHSRSDSPDIGSDASPTAAAPQQDREEAHNPTSSLSHFGGNDDPAPRTNRTTSSQAKHKPSKILEL